MLSIFWHHQVWTGWFWKASWRLILRSLIKSWFCLSVSPCCSCWSTWSDRNWTWWRRPPPAGSLQTPHLLHRCTQAEGCDVSPPAGGRGRGTDWCSAGRPLLRRSSCSAGRTAPAPLCWRWWCSWRSQSCGWSRQDWTGCLQQQQRWSTAPSPPLFSPLDTPWEHWTPQVWSWAGGPVDRKYHSRLLWDGCYDVWGTNTTLSIVMLQILTTRLTLGHSSI